MVFWCVVMVLVTALLHGHKTGMGEAGWVAKPAETPTLEVNCIASGGLSTASGAWTWWACAWWRSVACPSTR